MIIKSAFCQSLLEEAFKDFANVKFSYFCENRPSDEDLEINPINIYQTWEPNEYFGSQDWIKKNWYKFNAVLTWNPGDIPNAIFCPFGTSPFHDKLNELNDQMIQKENRVSFIRGNKHFNVPGHHLRWELFERQNEITFNKDFYAQTTPAYASNPEEEIQWFSQRQNIFSTNLFHIAIENTSNENYFTEKIIDCFLFQTVPIYFGCPNINNFFDPKGIITFRTVDELVEICNNLSMDEYISRREAVIRNQTKCLEYLDLGKTVHDRLETFFKFNGLLW